jgi:hypothetical protein
MAAPVALSPTFSTGPATKVFDNSSSSGGGAQGAGRTHDVSLDGSRFLMIKLARRDEAAQQLVVVLNWFEELERLIPAQ